VQKLKFFNQDRFSFLAARFSWLGTRFLLLRTSYFLLLTIKLVLFGKLVDMSLHAFAPSVPC